MINVLIPMAGLGSRFSIAGYKDPKPFIDVWGLPMIEKVISNLNMQDARFILLVRNDLTPKYLKILNELKKKYNTELITIELTTEGAACTTLFAYDFINDENELIIANSDQLVDFSINDMRVDAITRELAGSVLVFEDNDPKWSFVKIDKDGYLIDLKEKNPISNLATVGIYYFRRGSDYVKSAIKMIITNDRTNNEFYVAPTYNYLNKFSKKKIGVYRISKSQMHGLGTPEDLEDYLRHESS
jgi:UDP-N-acetylglucosamine diphosphorylase / glucose-1-phosphate thymidylyltransferase / UDP-N-acetylgalactosamine diphosphorylase / glucosamine-1-phosphate N-acetyltransferase / galactosamine-1-phosphate N-acetyltransferase